MSEAWNFGAGFLGLLVYGALGLVVLGVVGVGLLFVRDARNGRIW